jgi:hypothetical protein
MHLFLLGSSSPSTSPQATSPPPHGAQQPASGDTALTTKLPRGAAAATATAATPDDTTRCGRTTHLHAVRWSGATIPGMPAAALLSAAPVFVGPLADDKHPPQQVFLPYAKLSTQILILSYL